MAVIPLGGLIQRFSGGAAAGTVGGLPTTLAAGAWYFILGTLAGGPLSRSSIHCLQERMGARANTEAPLASVELVSEGLGPRRLKPSCSCRFPRWRRLEGPRCRMRCWEREDAGDMTEVGTPCPRLLLDLLLPPEHIPSKLHSRNRRGGEDDSP